MIHDSIQAMDPNADPAPPVLDGAMACGGSGDDDASRRSSADPSEHLLEELRRDPAFQPFLGRPGGTTGKPTVFVRALAKGDLPIGFGRVAKSNRDLTMDGLLTAEAGDVRIMPMTSRRGLIDWTGHGRDAVNEAPTLSDVVLFLPRVRRREESLAVSAHAYAGEGSTADERRLRHARLAAAEVRRLLARPSPDEGDRALAVDLLAGMAALKCDLGLAESCVREYVLMTGLCLGLADAPRAVASMRRAIACARLSGDRGDLREATANAFDTYLALRRVGQARRALGELAAIPADPGAPYDAGIAVRAAALDDLARSFAVPRAPGAGRNAAEPDGWCKLADRDPVEIALYATADGHRRPVSPFGEDRGSGLAQFMDAEAGHRDRDMFLVWRHVAGRWELSTVPDLATRHMAIARGMRDRAEADPDSTEGPTCAVTFAVAALEAFVNMTTYFVSLEGPDAWIGSRMPADVFANLARYQKGRACRDKWREIAAAMLGAHWFTDGRRSALHRLIRLRNDIAHYNTAEIEALQVDVKISHRSVCELRGVISPRPGPAPWQDRVLTPAAAGWAVSTAEELMSSFRQAFRDRGGAGNPERRDGARGWQAQGQITRREL